MKDSTFHAWEHAEGCRWRGAPGWLPVELTSQVLPPHPTPPSQ